jgi:uncharacterized protein DUF4349
MERPSDHNDLATALAEVRPVPCDAFAQELDKRVAAGFPRRSRFDNSPSAGFAAWVRRISPPRLLLGGAATVLAAIAIATVLVASQNSSSERLALDLHQSETRQPRHVQFSPPAREASGQASGTAGAGRQASEVQYATGLPSLGAVANGAGGEAQSATGNLLSFGGGTHRNIERSAEIDLLADPADVSEDSTKVFAAVHDANGIVLHSTTSSGKGGGARFELLIPSARLGDALAAFSSIDEVRSRHEATDDITKPTVTASEELQDSQARVDSLLAQLAGAEVESEREAIAAELDTERDRAARLRGQLAKLHQRTTYSRVLVRIQGGASTESGGAWGIGDAFGDAGHILGIAAGVTLVGLAVFAPLALLCLLAWLAQRLWLRTRRERALDA